jgi:histidine triad (HIT) family protein
VKDCLFCKIFRGEIPSTKVYQDELVYAFKNLHPMAPIHILFIHRDHTHNLNSMSEDPQSLADVFRAISAFTKKEGLDQSGFRVVTNVGPHAGQTVFHTHFHVLAGTQLKGFGA